MVITGLSKLYKFYWPNAIDTQMDKETINDSKNLLEDPPNKTDSKDIVLYFNVYKSKKGKKLQYARKNNF